MRWLLAPALLLLLSGCSSSTTFAQSRQGMTVDPGTIHEVNLQMKQGATFTYAWSSTGTLYFDIHSHRDGQTIEWQHKAGTNFSGTFKADLDGGYSLLWENDGRTHISLTYDVSGDGTVLGVS